MLFDSKWGSSSNLLYGAITIGDLCHFLNESWIYRLVVHYFRWYKSKHLNCSLALVPREKAKKMTFHRYFPDLPLAATMNSCWTTDLYRDYCCLWILVDPIGGNFLGCHCLKSEELISCGEVEGEKSWLIEWYSIGEYSNLGPNSRAPDQNETNVTLLINGKVRVPN